ncbi:MAG: hypothetical protein ACR2JH_03370 [Solirubrobacteraceae bacterium]
MNAAGLTRAVWTAYSAAPTATVEPNPTIDVFRLDLAADGQPRQRWQKAYPSMRSSLVARYGI